ncbi:MAG: electron transfer flavoprotein subunit alpha/FixB family protein [Ancrocorticia sp.]|uniref:electron transfer flavoprotein subunit alpha/FixB family protein n=1 Tax=Ancrocorticia sp. TaxID=2593684 RepID=UPI003F8DB993
MKTWIIAAETGVGTLADQARELGGTVTAVTVGNLPIAGVDETIAIELEATAPAEVAAPSVAAAIDAEPGDVVLAPNRPAERVLAGAVAAKLGAPVLTSVKSLQAGSAQVSKAGGISLDNVTFDGTVVAILDGGVQPAGEVPEAVTFGAKDYTATISAIEQAEVESVNLGSAERVVAAGRGFKEQDDLQLASDLAEAIGGEVACSRPLSEGLGWMQRDQYVGVSGQVIAPELYFAIGISGQVHHTAGILESGTIVAINNDETATMFEDSDYGIVGDLYEVIPQIVAALNE